MRVNSICTYFVRPSIAQKQTSFRGDDSGLTKESLMRDIHNLANVEGKDRFKVLNKVAVSVFNNPDLQDVELVNIALQFVPEEDSKHSAARYLTELLRLAKYTSAEHDLKTKIAETIRNNNMCRKLARTQKGFETTHCNVCGQEVDANRAQGYRSTVRIRHLKIRENEE